MNKKIVWNIVLIAGLGIFSGHIAQASPIAVDFTVTSQNAYGGFPVGTVGSGSFSFDDGIGNFYDKTSGVAPTHLAFNWLGTSWDESNVRIFKLTFGADGILSEWGIGGVPGACGLNCVDGSLSLNDFWAAADKALPTAAATMKLAGEFALVGGHIVWSVHPVTVPEPATLSMFAFSLLGAGIARRKLKR